MVYRHRDRRCTCCAGQHVAEEGGPRRLPHRRYCPRRLAVPGPPVPPRHRSVGGMGSAAVDHRLLPRPRRVRQRHGSSGRPRVPLWLAGCQARRQPHARVLRAHDRPHGPRARAPGRGARGHAGGRRGPHRLRRLPLLHPQHLVCGATLPERPELGPRWHHRRRLQRSRSRQQGRRLWLLPRRVEDQGGLRLPLGPHGGSSCRSHGRAGPADDPLRRLVCDGDVGLYRTGRSHGLARRHGGQATEHHRDVSYVACHCREGPACGQAGSRTYGCGAPEI
mmetsp:Transcript_22436/g.64505  ORF Transcript_22436/g.64505 Transcript_22436/m.64505 type:complete len:278 (+) Transcript_22436:1258-2091(+)